MPTARSTAATRRSCANIPAARSRPNVSLRGGRRVLGNAMPKLDFIKMNGAGNDFVMLDNRAGNLQLSGTQISRLCDRHRGIGADGVLMIEPASNGADFRMRYYNADGGEAEMCGNGARCFARYANRMAGPLDHVSFETPAGVIAAALKGEGVTLQMSEPRDMRLNINLSAAG